MALREFKEWKLTDGLRRMLPNGRCPAEEALKKRLDKRLLLNSTGEMPDMIRRKRAKQQLFCIPLPNEKPITGDVGDHFGFVLAGRRWPDQRS